MIRKPVISNIVEINTFSRKRKTLSGDPFFSGPIINETAAKYNGGGHKYASGARLNNEEEINAFIKDLDNVCEEYKRASISNIEI